MILNLNKVNKDISCFYFIWHGLLNQMPWFIDCNNENTNPDLNDDRKCVHSCRPTPITPY